MSKIMQNETETLWFLCDWQHCWRGKVESGIGWGSFSAEFMYFFVLGFFRSCLCLHLLTFSGFCIISVSFLSKHFSSHTKGCKTKEGHEYASVSFGKFNSGNIKPAMETLGYPSCWTTVETCLLCCICKPLKKEHLLQGFFKKKKNQKSVFVGTCGAGGSVAFVLQLNEDEHGRRLGRTSRWGGTKGSEGVSAADCCSWWGQCVWLH